MPDPFPSDALSRLIATALAEDIGSGDITSNLLIPESLRGSMRFVARESMVAAGLFIPAAVYGQLGAGAQAVVCAQEGQMVESGAVLAMVHGAARTLLLGERVALNLMQRLCGVATLTARYVEAVRGTGAVILDTRKTMPGLRALDKYAVRAGGGQNHRMRLDDMVLIKDNHIALAARERRGGIADLVAHARAHGGSIPVVVECDTLEQVQAALPALPERILLDNMTLEQMRVAVAMVAGRVPLEASGGVTLERVRAIAETGVDFISVGRLTHSAPNVDIGADVVWLA